MSDAELDHLAGEMDVILAQLPEFKKWPAPMYYQHLTH
jgi:hypothetical protein